MPKGILHLFDKQTAPQLLVFLPHESAAHLSATCQHFDVLLGPLKEWAYEALHDEKGNVKQKARGVKRISICKRTGYPRYENSVHWGVPSDVHTAIVARDVLTKPVVTFAEGLVELHWSQNAPLPELPISLKKLIFKCSHALPTLHEGLVYLSVFDQYWDFALQSLPETLQYLQLGYSAFNQPIASILPAGLLHLRIQSSKYSHVIEHWPSGLLTLRLPKSYEDVIDNLPVTLTRLECNSLPTYLPSSLIRMKLLCPSLPSFLPPNLTRLRLAYESVADFSSWPASLTSFKTHGMVRNLDKLPQSLRVFSPWAIEGTLEPMLSNLTFLNLRMVDYSMPLLNLPQTLLHLLLSSRFNRPLVLPRKLLSLSVGGRFNQPLDLPPTLTKLQIAGEFNQPLMLPPNLTDLFILGDFSQPLENLPASLTKLHLGDHFTHMLTLPANLKWLDVGHRYRHIMLDLPPSLKLFRMPLCNPTAGVVEERLPYKFTSCSLHCDQCVCQLLKTIEPEKTENPVSSSSSVAFEASFGLASVSAVSQRSSSSSSSSSSSVSIIKASSLAPVLQPSPIAAGCGRSKPTKNHKRRRK